MRTHDIVCVLIWSWTNAREQDPANNNLPSKTHAGRLLGRCHAALEDHELSVSALDAALHGARHGKLLFTEGLTVRARALVGRGQSSPHWDSHTSEERLREVIGRSQAGRGGGLLEKLLLLPDL